MPGVRTPGERAPAQLAAADVEAAVDDDVEGEAGPGPELQQPDVAAQRRHPASARRTPATWSRRPTRFSSSSREYRAPNSSGMLLLSARRGPCRGERACLRLGGVSRLMPDGRRRSPRRSPHGSPGRRPRAPWVALDGAADAEHHVDPGAADQRPDAIAAVTPPASIGMAGRSRAARLGEPGDGRCEDGRGSGRWPCGRAGEHGVGAGEPQQLPEQHGLADAGARAAGDGSRTWRYGRGSARPDRARRGVCTAVEPRSPGR